MTADGIRDFCPDHEAWQRIIAQMGISIAPPLMAPARTLGPTGFYVGFETWITGIESGASYWEVGTEGDRMAVERNRFVPNVLTWSRLAARKGFPFGIELGTSIGHAYQTSYWVLGTSFQISPFEGFRRGAGWLPDFAARGSVNTMAGDGEFNLTVAALDLVLSKPLVIAHTVTITPMLSGQLVWIFGDSEVVDLTPERSAFDECMPDPTPPMPGEDSTIRCAGGGARDDFTNSTVFDEIRAFRARLAFGAQLRYQQFTGTASFQLDIVDPSDDVPDG
jgi:hypothetical protein